MSQTENRFDVPSSLADGKPKREAAARLYDEYAELQAQAEEIRERKRLFDVSCFQSHHDGIEDLLYGRADPTGGDLGDWETWKKTNQIVERFAYSRSHGIVDRSAETDTLKDRLGALTKVIVRLRNVVSSQQAESASALEEISALYSLLRIREQENRELTNENRTCALNLSQLRRQLESSRRSKDDAREEGQRSLEADFLLLVQSSKLLEKENAELRYKLSEHYGTLRKDAGTETSNDVAQVSLGSVSPGELHQLLANGVGEARTGMTEEGQLVPLAFPYTHKSFPGNDFHPRALLDCEVPISSSLLKTLRAVEAYQIALGREVENAMSTFDEDANRVRFPDNVSHHYRTFSSPSMHVNEPSLGTAFCEHCSQGSHSRWAANASPQDAHVSSPSDGVFRARPLNDTPQRSTAGERVRPASRSTCSVESMERSPLGAANTLSTPAHDFLVDSPTHYGGQHRSRGTVGESRVSEDDGTSTPIYDRSRAVGLREGFLNDSSIRDASGRPVERVGGVFSSTEVFTREGMTVQASDLATSHLKGRDSHSKTLPVSPISSLLPQRGVTAGKEEQRAVVGVDRSQEAQVKSVKRRAGEVVQQGLRMDGTILNAGAQSRHVSDGSPGGALQPASYTVEASTGAASPVGMHRVLRLTELQDEMSTVRRSLSGIRSDVLLMQQEMNDYFRVVGTLTKYFVTNNDPEPFPSESSKTTLVGTGNETATVPAAATSSQGGREAAPPHRSSFPDGRKEPLVDGLSSAKAFDGSEALAEDCRNEMLSEVIKEVTRHRTAEILSREFGMHVFGACVQSPQHGPMDDVAWFTDRLGDMALRSATRCVEREAALGTAAADRHESKHASRTPLQTSPYGARSSETLLPPMALPTKLPHGKQPVVGVEAGSGYPPRSVYGASPMTALSNPTISVATPLGTTKIRQPYSSKPAREAQPSGATTARRNPAVPPPSTPGDVSTGHQQPFTRMLDHDSAFPAAPTWVTAVQFDHPAVPPPIGVHSSERLPLDSVRPVARQLGQRAAQFLFSEDFVDAVRTQVEPIARVMEEANRGPNAQTAALYESIRALRRVERQRQGERARLLFKRVAADIKVKRLLRRRVVRGSAFGAYITLLYGRWKARLEAERRRLLLLQCDEMEGLLSHVVRSHFSALPPPSVSYHHHARRANRQVAHLQDPVVGSRAITSQPTWGGHLHAPGHSSSHFEGVALPNDTTDRMSK